MNIKKLVRNIHLILGLISGIIVIIVAVTGCLYVFKSEIESLTQKEFRKVKIQNKAFLTPTEIKPIVKDIFPEITLHGIEYGRQDDAVQAIFYDSDPRFYRGIFMNPYTGEVLKIKDYYRDFFYLTVIGHYQLWLPLKFGQPIISISILVFIVMLITGIVLWWPKRGAARQSFKIKWQAPWKRRLFDLHSVLGFYANIVLLVIALTGLVWGFDWFASFVYKSTGGQKSTEFEIPSSDTTVTANANTKIHPVDWLWQKMQEDYPNAHHIEIHFPKDDKEALFAHVGPDELYWKTEYRYFDQHTFEEIETDNIYGKLENASTADIIRRMNYDIHIGAIGGLPGKILALFASLIAASLPITGFLMWRRRKKQTSESLLNDLS